MTGRWLAAGTAEFATNWLIQSTLLLALGLAAGRCLRRPGPALQAAVYRTTLVAVLLCPAAAALLLAAGLDGLMIRLPMGMIPAAVAVGPGDDEAKAALAGPALPPGELRGGRAEPHEHRASSAGVATPPGEIPDPSRAAIAPAVPPAPAAAADRATGPARPRGPWAVVAPFMWPGLAAWALGSAVLATRLLVGHRRISRLRAAAVTAEPEAGALCAELARRMGLGTPPVLRSPLLSSPCLCGAWRPAILLPDDVRENLRETIVHELAHLARRDLAWNLLRRAAVAALWVQPLLWVLSRRLEIAAEEICDDVVVQSGVDRARYAGLLLDLAERMVAPVAPAGVGMIALRSLLARRVVRILDSSRVPSTRAGGKALAATLAVGLAGTLLAGLLGVGGAVRTVAGDEPERARGRGAIGAAATPGSDVPRRTVRGRVLGPEGRPFAGATVTASRFRRTGLGPRGRDVERQELDRADTDPDGRFALTCEDLDPDSPGRIEDPDRWQGLMIVASARGFGPAWISPAGKEEDGPLTLELARDDVPVVGRLVDLEGRPVAGADVRVHLLYRATSPAAVDRWRETVAEAQAGDERPPSHYFPIANGPALSRGEPALPGPLTTDAGGRFRLDGLGRDRLANLEVSGPAIALRRVEVVTRRMPPVHGRPLDDPGLADGTYHGAECTIVVEPGRPIEGVVRDAATNEPIPGAVVTAMQRAGSLWGIEGIISAVTDAEGRYRLVGLPKGDGHKLSVYPPPELPYFVTGFIEVPGGPGLGPLPFDIALRRGLWIHGRVTDGATDAPVRAAIHYYPYLANEEARRFPNFEANRLSANWTGDRYRTDAEGRFRVLGLPGRGIVAARSYDRSYRLGVGAETIPERPGRQANRREGLPTYNQIHPRDFHAVAPVDPPAGAAEFRRDLTLDPGRSLTIRLVDEEGAPVAGATAWGRFPEAYDRGEEDRSDAGLARVVGLDPLTPRTLAFLQPGRKIGATLVVRPDDPDINGERTVVLRRCATVSGRLVDADGNAARGGVTIALLRDQPTLRGDIRLPDSPLDVDGRFRDDLVPPGGPYRVWARDRLDYGLPRTPARFKMFELSGNLAAGPGRAIDLGTFDVTTGKRIGATSASASAAPEDVPIRGRVLDLEGRPVAGIAVRVEHVLSPKGGDLGPWLDAVKAGAPPWIAYRHLAGSDPIPADDARRDATTDGDGRFRLDGLGGERVVTLKLLGDTIAATTLDVVTRRTGPIDAKGFPSSYGPGSETVQGGDFLYTARPGRPVEGIVRDAGTGQPLADVTVESYRFAGSDFVGTASLKATTDARGRFRLVGLPKGAGNRLLAVPNDDQPYFQREVPLGDPPGIGPVTVEIELHRGLWIAGRVTDKATGAPVKDARLHYLPFLENPFVRALPEFDKDGNVDGSQMRYKTRADGTYRLVGMPGRAIVGVDNGGEPSYRRGVGSGSIRGMDPGGHFPTWDNPIEAGRSWPLAMKEIDPAAGTGRVTLDLQLDPGLSVRLRTTDADGAPVAGVSVTGCESDGRTRTFPAAEFEVRNLAPDEGRDVIIRHEGRKVGKVLRIRAGADAAGPVVVTLEPLATIRGRAVDADGRPVPAAKVRPDLRPHVDFGLSLPEVVSGPDGRFEVSGVPPGCEYGLHLEAGTMIKERRYASIGATVRPGETTDVGDVRFAEE